MKCKSKIKQNCYDMLEIGYYTNGLEDNAKKFDNLNLILAKARIIDFLLDVSQSKEYITKKQYLKMALRLGDIEKFCLGWLENTKELMHKELNYKELTNK